MDILIDESGQFIPLAGRRSRAAAVVGLVVPSADRTRLARDFCALKRSLRPGVIELKGASLNEAEAAAFFRLLHSYDLVADAIVIDVGAHDDGEVTRFKLQQAENLTSGITRDHQPGLIQDVVELQHGIRQLANQLFIQAFCIWELLPRLLETATLYYSQRHPAELGAFTWRVDAKGEEPTPVEGIWRSLLLPLMYTRSLDSPMAMIETGDYSYFRRFDTTPEPPDVPEDGKYYTDLRSIFREDFRFMSSDESLGLQMVDIVASVLTRALNGSITEQGWLGLGRLFVHRSEQTIRLVALSTERPSPSRRPVTNPHWISVIRRLEHHTKSVIAV